MEQQDAIFMQKFTEEAQFETVKEMDEHVQLVLAQFSASLNKTDAAVLDYLKQRATRVIGVAYTKVATIAAAIEKSVRTVNYATSKLEKLGVIKKLEVMRDKKGGYGANAYLILNCRLNCSSNCSTEIAERQEAEKPCKSKDEEPKIEGTSLYSFNSFNNSLKSLNKKSVKAAPVKIEHVLFSNIPSLIKSSLELLADNALGNAIWKKVIQAYVQSDLYNALGNVHLQTAIENNELFYAQLQARIHNVAYAQEHGTVRTDVLGYIYGTCRAFFNDEAIALIENNTPETDYDEHIQELCEILHLDRVSYKPVTVYAVDNDKYTREEMNDNGLF